VLDDADPERPRHISIEARPREWNKALVMYPRLRSFQDMNEKVHVFQKATHWSGTALDVHYRWQRLSAFRYYGTVQNFHLHSAANAFRTKSFIGRVSDVALNP
jgi:hypothetical protein